MWLLVRANAVDESPDGSARLAACPDSGARGETWRWTVWRRRDAQGVARVAVEADPDHVVAETSEPGLGVGEVLDLPRAAGEEVVLTVLAGRHLVEHHGGPWQRSLGEGDVLVVEGEQAEPLRVTGMEPGRVAVVRLAATGAQALRWVP